MMSYSMIESIKAEQVTKVTVEKAYVAMVDVTERESRIFGYFSTKELAERLTRGKGWYGGNGWVNKEPVDIVILEFFDGSSIGFPVKSGPGPVQLIRSETAYDEIKKADLREQALKKLSQAERDALGIKS